MVSCAAVPCCRRHYIKRLHKCQVMLICMADMYVPDYSSILEGLRDLLIRCIMVPQSFRLFLTALHMSLLICGHSSDIEMDACQMRFIRCNCIWYPSSLHIACQKECVSIALKNNLPHKWSHVCMETQVACTLPCIILVPINVVRTSLKSLYLEFTYLCMCRWPRLSARCVHHSKPRRQLHHSGFGPG